MFTWHCKNFQELSTLELYAILKARQDVFVIEQACIYPDFDGLDQQCLHLFATLKDNSDIIISAYLRILPPNLQYSEASMGRVLTTHTSRGTGVGKVLVQKAINTIQNEYPLQPIRISAQHYLQIFYSRFGFKAISEIYEEDGIPHIAMLLK
ncbi:MAG: GNAT family N-acetyltransferase [Oceanospirillaceae bacterium]